jgi:hypothetical protein
MEALPASPRFQVAANRQRLDEAAHTGVAERLWLLLRHALTMRHFGVFSSCLRMPLGSRGLFAPLLVISFAMMLSSRVMAFGGVFVMFGRFVVGVLGHANLLS